MKDTLWNGFGILAEVWFSLILIAVLAIVGWVNATRRDVAFILVILWALAGIAIKHSAVRAVIVPAWLTFALVSASLLLPLGVRPIDLSEKGA